MTTNDSGYPTDYTPFLASMYLEIFKDSSELVKETSVETYIKWQLQKSKEVSGGYFKIYIIFALLFCCFFVICTLWFFNKRGV